MARLSTLATEIPLSGIREIVHHALPLEHVIRLELGESSSSPPPEVIEAVARDSANGHTRYTAAAGDPELRTAIVEKLRRVNGIDADVDDVVVTVGAAHAVLLGLLTYCNPGDEVLVPDPAWPTYAMAVRLVGACSVTYRCEAPAFLPDPDEIASLVGPRTRVLILNSPNNPSGAVYPQALVERLIQVAERHDLTIIDDLAYDEIYFGDPPVAVGSVMGATDSRCLSVFTFSKSYAMTGYRVGYAVASRAVTEAFIRLQEPTVSCVSAPSQRAGLAALSEAAYFPEQQRIALSATRRRIGDLLESFGVRARLPDGAFYLMLDVRPLESRSFALDLLRHDGISVAPGSACGETTEGFIRICFAAGGSELDGAVQRIFQRLKREQRSILETSINRAENAMSCGSVDQPWNSAGREHE